MGEWIKPQDSLPETAEPILVYGYKNGKAYPTTARFIPSFGWTNYWTGESMPVKYWMPLPKEP